MAKIILNDREVKLLNSVSSYKDIEDALNILAGHLGGYGIDVLNERGEDILPNIFSYVSESSRKDDK